ncbi:MAG: glycosyltransferase family 4 protein [Pseudomonadota bacterium]
MTGDAPEILALTRHGRMGASSRVRIMQFAPYFEAAGLRLTIAPFVDDAYLAQTYAGRRPIGATLGAYLRRARTMARARPAAFWLEKEALPWVPGWVEQSLKAREVPILSDYDDAVFHTYDEHRLPLVRRALGTKIDRVMSSSDVVLAGNAYLAARAKAAGALDVRIVPTAVDMSDYRPRDEPKNGSLTVGWIGSPSTWKYHLLPRLQSLEEALRPLGAEILVVGSGERGHESDVTRFLDWSEAGEIAAIQQMDIGIMPLPDDAWSRGKCGYKLIQYMACALPVVASPVGVNKCIVEHGRNGLLAERDDEWQAALKLLIAEAGLRKDMGREGRKKIAASFSTQVWGPRIAEVFKTMCEMRGITSRCVKDTNDGPQAGSKKCAG